LFVLMAFIWWAFLVFTGLSLVGMTAELRFKSVPVKLPPLTFNPVLRIRHRIEIISTYRRFKREQNRFPLFLWTMVMFGLGTIIIPLGGLFLLFIRRSQAG